MYIQRQSALPCRVIVAGICFIDKWEAAVDEAHKAAGRSPADLLLDLSEVTFVDLPTLHYIIALTLLRKRQGLRTAFRVPGGQYGEDARDFLRRWKFPESFKIATEIPFHKFTVPEDLKYFRRFKGDRGPRRYAASHRRIEPQISEAGQVGVGRAEASEVAAQDTRSSGSGIYVQSRIVFEAMTNAVRHPGAALIQCSSLLRPSPSDDWTFNQDPGFFPFTTWKVKEYSEKGRIPDEAADAWNVEPVMSILNRHLDRSNTARSRGKHFTIVFWDDGKSMVGTLSEALTAGLSIRDPAYPDAFDTQYHVRFINPTGHEITEVLNSKDTPDKQSPEYHLLVATLYPGITCDVTGVGHRVHSALANAEPAMAGYGMGLFALVRTALDEFGGTVAFRTGRYFMNVKRNQRQYQVKIEEKRQTTPPFLGNMLTVRLPLKNA